VALADGLESLGCFIFKGFFMCKCINVKTGSYDNQVVLKAPDHMANRDIGSCMTARETFCIDKCIAEEVQSLWDLGITTVGCCCGHNKPIGYIQVIQEDINQMIELGYEIDTGSIGAFFTKTLY